MEHQKPRQYRILDTQIGRFLLLLTTLSIQVSCKQPLEYPEQADPIYSDLMAETNAAKNSITSEEKSVKDLKEQIAALKPRDSSRAGLLRQLASAEQNLTQARQRKIYFEVRAEQRKEYDQKAYREAFDNNKPWPNPDEIAEYKKLKKLKSSSRNWEDRVPKTTRYNKTQPHAVEKKEKTPEGGSSH